MLQTEVAVAKWSDCSMVSLRDAIFLQGLRHGAFVGEAPSRLAMVALCAADAFLDGRGDPALTLLARRCA